MRSRSSSDALRLKEADAAVGLGRLQLAALAGGAALVPLNSTMLAVALPRIADDFDISIGTTGLLVTVYLIAMLVGQPLAGRLGDAVGHRRLVRIALVGFAATSVVGAVAPEFAILVAARIGQAVCGASIGPGVQAMLRQATAPHERGRAFGLFGSVIGIGAAAGPVIGGGVTQLFGWPAIMLVNLPIVAVALLALPEVVDRVATNHAGAATDGSTWRNRVFLSCFAVQALTTVGQYMLLLVTPVVLEARGWSSGAIGFVLASLTVGLILMGPPGGRRGDRAGRRAPVVPGVGLTVVAVGTLAASGADVPALVLVIVLAASGIGLGFATPSIMTAALESVDESRSGTASGILSMSRYVGSISASILVSAWLADDGSGASGPLWIATAAAMAAFASAFVLPARR